MFRMLVIGALSAIAAMFSGTAFAQGTAAEAKAIDPLSRRRRDPDQTPCLWPWPE